MSAASSRHNLKARAAVLLVILVSPSLYLLVLRYGLDDSTFRRGILPFQLELWGGVVSCLLVAWLVRLNRRWLIFAFVTWASSGWIVAKVFPAERIVAANCLRSREFEACYTACVANSRPTWKSSAERLDAMRRALPFCMLAQQRAPATGYSSIPGWIAQSALRELSRSDAGR